MQALKLTQIGNSLGIILPKEILARLKVEKGDQLFLTEAPDGFRVSNSDPEFALQMKVAEDIMRKRRNVLRELAK
jgi:putative addiction module antidote